MPTMRNACNAISYDCGMQMRGDDDDISAGRRRQPARQDIKMPRIKWWMVVEWGYN